MPKTRDATAVGDVTPCQLLDAFSSETLDAAARMDLLAFPDRSLLKTVTVVRLLSEFGEAIPSTQPLTKLLVTLTVEKIGVGVLGRPSPLPKMPMPWLSFVPVKESTLPPLSTFAV